MGILTKEVEVQIVSTNIKYYEEHGYKIPKVPKKNYRNKMVFVAGTKILVKVEDLPKYSQAELQAECDCCGKKYPISYSNYNKVNRDGLVYCRSCAKKLFNSKENNPNYKPELTDEDRDRKRIGTEYTNFIKRVLARDNYTCQCCGKHKSELNCSLVVHHLDSYNWCKDKRTDDNNGITLCENCHGNFHNIYGNGYNTKEQFEEWFGKAINLLKYDGEILPTRKIFCYEENKVYNSVGEFCYLHDIKSTSSIYSVCNHKKKHKTIKGLHVFWYDEYICMTSEKLDSFLNAKPIRNRKPVICLNTMKIYDSLTSAANKTGMHKESIRNCCHHIHKYVHLKDGTLQQWMFYEEYLELQKNNNNMEEHEINKVA